MRRISEELIAILRQDASWASPNTALRNIALLYLNRVSFEELKHGILPPGDVAIPPGFSSINQLFGIPIMLFYMVPIDRWELVQRSSGEPITSGNLWEPESGALCGYRWMTYNAGLVPDTKDHQCIVPAGHYPRSHCVCECGMQSVVPPQ